MRYWWANQQHTYDEEVAGGYLWSRQRRADGTRNPFYENLRLAQVGDIIFAYSRASIRAVGVVASTASESGCPAPLPGGAPPEDATVPGWIVDVAWLELKRPLRPADHMTILAPLLPDTHAPLTPTGKGIQGGRLLELPATFALALLQLAGGTSPERLVNPCWQPRQMRFGFADAEPRIENPVLQDGTHENG